ncbi:hypothetical protein, partial [Streptomyces lavendulae]|uniref:hypothetical protein n=1 Tax=Streptomyces lavendulae TaxID=1914 RepID=UPI0025558ACD
EIAGIGAALGAAFGGALGVTTTSGPGVALKSETIGLAVSLELTLARPWAVPGTPGLEHRIGGIEKQDGTGNISYDPANHDFMVRTRQAKIDGIQV